MISYIIIISIGIIIGLLSRLLFFERDYKVIKDNFCVRHGKLGKWVILKEHMKEHEVND